MQSAALKRIGRRAPPLRVRVGTKVITFDRFARQPIVLALLDRSVDLMGGDLGGANTSLGETPSDVLSAVQAELRGLGAMLLLLSPQGAFVLGADDDAEWLAPAQEIDEDDFERACRAFGLRREQQAPGVCRAGLFLVDSERFVRFAHVWEDAGEVSLATLGDGLAAAGRAVIVARERLVFSRRDLVMTSLIGAFSLLLLDGCKHEARLASDPRSTGPRAVAGEQDVTLDVNGVQRSVRIDTRTSLLDALRERLGLTGTKKGCDHGQCGACTVHVDGKRVNSCLLFAVAVEGSKITTIEGLARGDTLHPMQQAFVSEDALQCGYCTPGQIMSAVAMLGETHPTTDDEIREQMSGNICRCGAYTNIVAAIQRARKV